MILLVALLIAQAPTVDLARFDTVTRRSGLERDGVHHTSFDGRLIAQDGTPVAAARVVVVTRVGFQSATVAEVSSGGDFALHPQRPPRARDHAAAMIMW
jgi:hypothetical protein